MRKVLTLGLALAILAIAIGANVAHAAPVPPQAAEAEQAVQGIRTYYMYGQTPNYNYTYLGTVMIRDYNCWSPNTTWRTYLNNHGYVAVHLYNKVNQFAGTSYKITAGNWTQVCPTGTAASAGPALAWASDRPASALGLMSKPEAADSKSYYWFYWSGGTRYYGGFVTLKSGSCWSVPRAARYWSGYGGGYKWRRIESVEVISTITRRSIGTFFPGERVCSGTSVY